MKSIKSTLSRALIFLSLLSCTTKIYSQLAPSPTLATSNVTEASQYGVLYQLNIPVSANFSSLASILYSIDNSSLSLNYNRIAYFLQLDNKWVWVSMNKFNTTNAQLGVPYNNSGIIWQQVVTGMNVYSSVGSGVTNTTGISGNIEIWPDCYSQGNALGGIGGNGGTYDFNDTRSAGSNCFGSFQVHNYGASQTVFALNNFMGGTIDLGIGNNVGNANPDWTFMSNAASYTTTRKLWILVQNGISFMNQPSTAAQTACVNGTVSALTVSVAVNSGTITNYQWYSVATATNAGGTLVATHTTSLTTDSYTPSTTVAGTLYYYCVANGTGGFSTASTVSGVYTVGNPTLSISGTGSICAGGSLVLTANSSASPSTFTWSSGANTSNITVSPTVTTTYSVSGTSTLGCIGNSSLVTVTVNPRPVITVASGTICNGGSFLLSPSGASTYTYSGGLSTVMPAVTTNYTVSGTSALGCVGSNTSVTVVVNPLPLVSITGVSSICVGSSASLTANGASTYTWSNNSNAVGISVSPGSNTTYSLSGTSSDGCLSSSPAVLTVTVNALPVLTITGDNTVCAGSAVALTAGGASTYTWNTSSNSALINVTPGATTSYSVAGTSVDGCLSSADAVTTVSVNALPLVTISGTNAICEGASASLTAGGANTYTWDSGSNATSISVSPLTTTTYSLSGASAEGCISAAPAVISLTVNTLPIVSITGATSICVGASTSLTANGAATYTWSDNSNGSALSVSPVVNTSYSLSGTSSEGCLSNVTAVFSLTVNALPVLAIIGDNTVCAGSSVALTVGGASTYTWNTSSNSALINVTPATTTTYSVAGTSTDGCLSAANAVTTITVNNLPLVTISGTNAICAGASASFTAGGASTYTWDTGSNATGISVSPLTNTTYSLSGTSIEGCMSAAPAVISLTVNALPLVSITGTTSICAGTSTSLTANGATTYTWSNSSNATGISVSPTVNTTYSLSGTSSDGCLSNAPAVLTLTVNALPVLTIAGDNTVCAGSSVALTAGGASTYTWNTSSNSALINVTPVTTTSYSVSGTSIDGCLSATDAVTTISVNSLPLVTISGTNAICAGASANFTASGASTYTWNTGSNASSISVSPLTNSTYSLSGTSAAGCTSATQAVISLTVNALPVLSITGTSSICAGGSTSLTANGASTYTWSGLGSTTLISVSPLANTSYTLGGTNSLGCIGIPVISTVTVNALPLITITGTNALCAGNSSSLSSGGANTYTWTGLGSSTLIVVSPSVTTTYTLSGTNAAGCSNFASKTVSVNALPVLNISGSSGICTGQNATLTVSGASTYSWSTGSTSNSIVTTPAVNTTYTVTGTDLLGCVNTSTQLVTVASSLSVSIGGPATICSGDILNLSGLGASTYTWNTGATTGTISPTPTVTTTYSVIGASGTCSNTAVKTVTVNANPTVSISGVNAICAGASATLSASGATSYSWTNASNTALVILTPSTSTAYTVTGYNPTGCSSNAITTVTVYALPTLIIAGDSVICLGNSAVLTLSGADTYTWSTSASTTSISVSPVSNSTYSAVGTDTNGCVNSSSVANVTVNPLPALTVISSASVVCSGDSITFTASGADTYTWNGGVTTNTVTYASAVGASYSVTGTNTFACSSSTSIAITVNALPVLAISGPTAMCTNESANLNVSGANSYTWNTGDNGTTLLITPGTTTTYSVAGTSVDGCSGSSTLQVNVGDCTSLNSVVAADKISMYPNPAQTQVTIELVDPTNAVITIRDVLGQVLVNQNAESVTTLRLQEFDNGLYYVTVTRNNAVIYSNSLIKN